MKAEIEGTTIKLDLQTLVESLDDDAKRTLANMLAFDERLLIAITEAAADGSFHQDDEDGWWHIGGDFLQRLRAKLIPLMPEATRELVRDLVQQRDQARALQNQQREDYWKLWHAWPQHVPNRPEPSRDFPHVGKISASEADAIVAGERTP